MNKELIKVTCTELNDEAKGLITVKGEQLALNNLLKGEKAVVDYFHRKLSNDAKVVKIEEKSPSRVTPPCPYFYECGGCQLQHMNYEAQLAFKQNRVEKLLKKYGKINPIIGMDTPYNYRNKMHSTLTSDKKGDIFSGIYEENTHRVIPIDKCLIQDPVGDKIVETLRVLIKSFKLKPYHEDSQQGFIRHILIKTGFASKQVMVVLVVTSTMFPSKKNFVDALRKKHPEITTIVMNVNNKQTNMVLGDKEEVFYGKGFIEDTLCGCVFQISPKSFYQVNPVQTEKLYTKAVEMAKLKGTETVLDAYCGIGTISLVLSKKVKEVIGVELNKDAVKDAINNAKRNKIDNARFYQGDAGDFMREMVAQKKYIDVLFMDPPRSGSDEKFLGAVSLMKPKQIVYISCNPETQARDVAYLVKKGYQVKEMQPFDMFSQTVHVENIVLLIRPISSEKK